LTTEFNLDWKGNLKLNRACTTNKVKILETNKNCQVLGIDNVTKYRIYDSVKEQWLGLIYDSVEFKQDNASANPAIFSSFSTSVDTRAQATPLNQIAQLENAGLGFKTESVEGIRYYSYLENDYVNLPTDVTIYNQPSADISGNPSFDYDYFTELSSPRAVLSGIKFAQMSEVPIDIVYYNFDEGIMYMDAFELQNYADYKYDTDGFINDVTNAPEITVQLSGCRDYDRVGTNETIIWVSYTVGTNYGNQDALTTFPILSSTQQSVLMTETTSTTGGAYDYEYVERVAGVNKFGTNDHKSNIYSVEIKDSNLNESITDPDLRRQVHMIVERAIREFAKKAAPAHTQLWKIVWKGE